MTADAVYGQQYTFRQTCEQLGYALAVPTNQRVITTDGTEHRADELIGSLPGQAWRIRSAGTGTKGERRYGWARVAVRGPNHPDSHYWLLVRASLAAPTIWPTTCATPRPAPA